MTQDTILDCGHKPSPHSDFTTGYGLLNGKTACYACCAETDKRHMRESGRIALYLTTEANGDCRISNWPGSLSFRGRYQTGRHNIAGCRYDAWFKFEGHVWHGVTYGDNTQICHCRRTKETYQATA